MRASVWMHVWVRVCMVACLGVFRASVWVYECVGVCLVACVGLCMCVS